MNKKITAFLAVTCIRELEIVGPFGLNLEVHFRTKSGSRIKNSADQASLGAYCRVL
jgi:hypothetical protein